MTNILPFDKKLKLYVFKDEDSAQVSFKVNDYCTVNKRFTIDEMRQIVDNWRDPGVSGLETEDAGRIWWEYRDCGPRPACEPAEFVAVSIQGWNWRLTVAEMQELVDTFHFQLNNTNHWD